MPESSGSTTSVLLKLKFLPVSHPTSYSDETLPTQQNGAASNHQSAKNG
jgi:hypothetical protein